MMLVRVIQDIITGRRSLHPAPVWVVMAITSLLVAGCEHCLSGHTEPSKVVSGTVIPSHYVCDEYGPGP
jgi:hypothetical protein